MIFCLIVPEFLDWLALILGLISVSILAWILYKLLLRPALDTKAERDAPPPVEGFKHILLIEDADRFQEISIGQLDGTINTRLNGIEEDQLVLKFVKDRGLEEYEITVLPGNRVFYRRPHAKKLEILKEKDEFAGRELIGYPALFRVAASVNKDNRPLQYIEFELTTSYIFNNIGEEKMQFTLELLQIYPGLDENSRNKKGIFSFGRPQHTED